jgi:hypothetical protein
VLETTLIIFLILFELVGIVLAALTFPGPLFASFCCLVYFLVSDDPMLKLWHIILFFAISIFSEGFDVVSSYIGAKKFGKASTLAGLSSIVFGLLFAALGTFIIPVPFLGTIIGALVGTFLGAFLVEAAKNKRKGLKVAFGSMLARLFAMLLKIAFAVFILAFTLFELIFRIIS